MFNYKRLRERRLDMGLTLEEVGNIVGISRSAIQKHEKGIIKNVYTSTVELFAKALRCSPAFLMGWEDSPNVSINANSSNITSEEMEIIEAYREQPHLQEAVEKVLGVHKDDYVVNRKPQRNNMETAQELTALSELTKGSGGALDQIKITVKLGEKIESSHTVTLWVTDEYFQE